MNWTIPQTDLGVSRWLQALDDDALDRFITDAEYLLADPDPSGDGQLVLATILGAARRWRDDEVPPLKTLRETAPTGFYDEVGR